MLLDIVVHRGINNHVYFVLLNLCVCVQFQHGTQSFHKLAQTALLLKRKIFIEDGNELTVSSLSQTED